MKKKLVALLMAIVLFGGFAASLPTSAAEYSEDELAERILYIKDLFGIADEYCNFSQDVWNNGEHEEWSFYWSNADSNKSIYVTTDEKNRIKSYNCYDYGTRTDRMIPAGLPEDYEYVALDFFKKAMPEVDGHVRLVSTSLDYYDNTYYYRYERVENGYPVADNSVSVSVDYREKAVQYAYANWDYDVKFAKPGKVISKKDAASKLNGKLDLSLRYISRYVDGGKEVFLAYVPSTKYYSVDAVSGKVYKEKNYYNYTDYEEAETAMADEAKEAGGRNGATLTDAELKKIKEAAGLISKDEAIAAVSSNKSLYLESTLKQTTAYLTSYNDGYYWQITMTDPRPVDYSQDDYYRAYAYASVDAKTGKLVNFNASVRDYYNYDDAGSIELKYNKKQCESRFEKFAKSLEPEKFAQTKKTYDEGGYIIYWDSNYEKSVYGGRQFTYTRLVNDVPFYDDSISGCVDRVTGKIYSYYVNWSEDITFPSTDGAISAKKAFDKYLESDDFKLCYELTSVTEIDSETYISTTKVDSRLCYVTCISAPYLDPFTGKFLNYRGEEYSTVSGTGNYTDISGHKYEKEIRFIGQLTSDIEGDKFMPDKAADMDFVKKIFEGIWILYRTPEIKGGSKAVTREELAAACIESLGLGEVAKLDIYRLDYKDAAKIAKKNKGAVAIAGGLGLFDVGTSGKFKPKAKVTRGEVAAVIARTITANVGSY